MTGDEGMPLRRLGSRGRMVGFLEFSIPHSIRGKFEYEKIGEKNRTIEEKHKTQDNNHLENIPERLV